MKAVYRVIKSISWNGERQERDALLEMDTQKAAEYGDEYLKVVTAIKRADCAEGLPPES